VSLRPYQIRSIERVREAVRGGARAVLLVMPTGAGKTRTCGEIVRRSVAAGRRALAPAAAGRHGRCGRLRLTAAGHGLFGLRQQRLDLRLGCGRILCRQRGAEGGQEHREIHPGPLSF
jgi:hypothetical protein